MTIQMIYIGNYLIKLGHGNPFAQLWTLEQREQIYLV